MVSGLGLHGVLGFGGFSFFCRRLGKVVRGTVLARTVNRTNSFGCTRFDSNSQNNSNIVF